MGGWGTNQHRGTPWNPWDPEVARTPGGSSSGSGVAVAAGLAPVGDRHRYRRLGAIAGLVVRHHRAQDDDRPRQHLRRPAARARRSTRRGRWRARSRTRRCSTTSCRARTRSTRAPAAAYARRPDADAQARRARAAARPHAGCASATASRRRCSPPMTPRSIELARLGAEIVAIDLPRRLRRLRRR